MTNKELRRLSRAELVEMLLTRENAQLTEELNQTRQQHQSKTLLIENAGSLDEAFCG